MSGTISGKAWVFGDDIDTDQLAPGLYMKGGVEAMAAHCLESANPDFARGVAAGDIVVAGENFGMGSSREQAAMALNALGVGAVVAKSFARIFYRNAVNLALPVLVCPDAGRIAADDRLAVDPAAGTIRDETQGIDLACEPLPDHLMALIEDGGLIPHLKKKLAARAA